MQSVEIISRVTIDDLLNSVKALESKDFEQFVEKIMLIKAQRKADFISKNEADLLQKINQSLPIEVLEQYDFLQQKRANKTLSEIEFQELAAIVEQKELLNAERLKYLGELSTIRKVSLRQLMKDLNLLNDE